MNTLRFNEIVFMNFYMIQRVNRKVQNTDILTPTHHSIGRSADKKLTPYDLLMHASHGVHYISIKQKYVCNVT